MYKLRKENTTYCIYGYDPEKQDVDCNYLIGTVESISTSDAAKLFFRKNPNYLHNYVIVVGPSAHLDGKNSVMATIYEKSLKTSAPISFDKIAALRFGG